MARSPLFLSRPDEKRLWLTIAGLLGVSVVLMLAALQFPWYTASYYAGPAEYRGEFDFEEARIQQFSNDREGDRRTLAYEDDWPMGDLMATTEVIVGIGIAAGIGFGALLGAYYYGYLQGTRWVKVSWIVGVGTLVLGIVYFALNAGQAAADQVVQLLRNIGAGSFESPEPVFWGTQVYGNGDLVSAPGVGWLLAILAVLNLSAATVLLYQFPERAPPEESFLLGEADEPAREKKEGAGAEAPKTLRV